MEDYESMTGEELIEALLDAHEKRRLLDKAITRGLSMHVHNRTVVRLQDADDKVNNIRNEIIKRMEAYEPPPLWTGSAWIEGGKTDEEGRE